MLNFIMGKGHNVPAPTGGFSIPELRLSKGELYFD
jgi:hypothetical protein